MFKKFQLNHPRATELLEKQNQILAYLSAAYATWRRMSLIRSYWGSSYC